MIRLRCRCHQTLKLSDDHLGQLVACPKCRDRLRVVTAGGAHADTVRANFVIVRGPARAGEVVFPGGREPIGIGKLSDNPLCLQAESVSRRHARLVPVASGWRLEDQGSTNGLHVNGERVRARDLQDGDVVRIGDFELRYNSAATHVGGGADRTAGSTAILASSDHLGLDLLDDPHDTQQLPDDPGFGCADDDAAPARSHPTAVAVPGTCPYCHRQLVPGASICVTCGTDLQTGRRLQITAEGAAAGSETDTHLGRFLRDSAWSFAFLAQPSNLLKFLILSVMLAIGNVAAVVFGCFGLLAWIVMAGYVFSFWFSVVEGAANGDPELPEISLDGDGWFDGYLAPILKFVASWLLTLVPAIVFMIVTEEDPASPSPAFLGLALLGVYFWPMLILAIALGGMSALTRIDLMLRSIFTAFVPYTIMTVLVAGAFMIVYSSETAARSNPQMFGGNVYVTYAMLVILQVYAVIVSMRCVGLFYFHFKDRLAFSWG